MYEEFGNPNLYSQTEDYNRSAVYVDGKKTLKWMRDNKKVGWKEVEWAGYYLRHKFRDLAVKKYSHQFSAHTDRKQYRVKGNYLWDLRVRSIAVKPTIILNDLEIFEKLVRENSGIGLIVLNALMFYDTSDQTFRQYQESLKGESSDYVLQSETVGRPPRLRKTGFMITRIFSYYFQDNEIFKGLNDGWLRNDFQKGMKNADGTLRNPKYTINLYKTPIKYLLENRNFNSDPLEEDLSNPVDGL